MKAIARIALAVACAAVALADRGSRAYSTNVPMAAPAPPASVPELIVGSKRGLEAWRWDGSATRMISEGPARHPRWLDERSVLVLRSETPGDLARGARLERVLIADGQRTKLAALPVFACANRSPDAGPLPDWWVLNIQGDDDFVLDASARFVCLDMMDRNINMASVSLSARVDLHTGRVARWLNVFDSNQICAPPAGVVVGEPVRCSAREPANHAASSLPEASLRFAFENEQLFEKQDGRRVPRARLANFSVEERGRSPSGRWMVLGGDLYAADYIHRHLVLFDRVGGDVFPIRPRAGTWPPALQPKGGKRRRIATPVTNTIEALGETDVRWLEHSPDAELLIVGSLVVRPGVGSFDVHGDVAR